MGFCAWEKQGGRELDQYACALCLRTQNAKPCRFLEQDTGNVIKTDRSFSLFVYINTFTHTRVRVCVRVHACACFQSFFLSFLYFASSPPPPKSRFCTTCCVISINFTEYLTCEEGVGVRRNPRPASHPDTARALVSHRATRRVYLPKIARVHSLCNLLATRPTTT